MTDIGIGADTGWDASFRGIASIVAILGTTTTPDAPGGLMPTDADPAAPSRLAVAKPAGQFEGAQRSRAGYTGIVNEADIASVLAQARAGDPDSLATLCAHLYPHVLKYMCYRVGPQVAEDLTSEVFVRLLRHLARQNGSFPAWLYTIAAHVVHDYLRRHIRDRNREVPITETGESDAELLSPAATPAQEAGRKLDLEHALSQLTDDQRQLITLKFLQGLANEDIAQIMDRSVGAIRILQLRALTALRQLLPQYEFHHEN